MSHLARLKKEIADSHHLEEELESLKVLSQLAIEEDDKKLADEVEQSIASFSQELDKFEENLWFRDETDSHNAILIIHPGAGGTESQDWAEMLLRMYIRWASNRSYKTIINEISTEEEAGIKSATITIKGENAFGWLSGEKGVHRLVRISPFDASKRRHTSFASVDVVPDMEEDIVVSIEPKDIKIETYRSSGAGGQHVNVTDSAVRITHFPSGIVVQCQNERSQLQNKETALKILKSRLYQKELEEKEKQQAVERGKKKEIAWGSQIRSYVIHPYTLVKDHRTNVQKGNVEAVLNGNIDDFIIAYQRWKLARKK
jgi:peptide chain release factor 2